MSMNDETSAIPISAGEEALVQELLPSVALIAR